MLMALQRRSTTRSRRLPQRTPPLSDGMKPTKLIFENRIKAHYDEVFAQVNGTDGVPINIVRYNVVEKIGHKW